MAVWEEIKQSFKSGSAVTKLIYVNIAVFITVRLIHAIGVLFLQFNDTEILSWLAVPAYLSDLFAKPWTIISYMFLHFDFLHILFNMLVLYWFGTIFTSYLNEKKLITTYILGGIAGALLYIFAFNTIPLFQPVLKNSIALGASASVMAIVIAISFYIPNHSIRLMFIGEVKLKYIALVYLGIDILSIVGENAGGHIAHLGGALYGIIFITQYKKSKDIDLWMQKLLDWIVGLFKPRSKMKVNYNKGSKKNPGFNRTQHETDMEYNARKASEQEEINTILDKIAKSGYDSLSKAEKEKLFKMSNKN